MNNCAAVGIVGKGKDWFQQQEIFMSQEIKEYKCSLYSDVGHIGEATYAIIPKIGDNIRGKPGFSAYKVLNVTLCNLTDKGAAADLHVERI